MPQRTQKGRAVHGDELSVHLSSGYTAIIHRPPLQVIRAVMTKAEADYPLPEAPTTTLQAATGVQYEVALDDDSPEAAEHKKAAAAVEAKRHEYLLEYAFQKRLVIEGYESPEQRQALIAKHAADRAELLEWGTLPEDMRDLDDWQLTLRTFVVADGEDLAAVFFAVMKAFDESGITPDEVRRRANFTT